ncbi:phosphoribosylglycinamide formyltransferase [Phenylobacterium sp. 20VBR1]|uniref:Phosphoribosylglycinamide formyltransferase n=1 Tax=Phenylobacterium glaciei TaxID=2803784 RepID=A0A941HWL4_9CAUL|nr:phosphoribosylglycinamide formyltransferase [Phenylobacterium glaciei]MBR7619953.1 phosphoribosylglycinamide formyltransferase [Phenylobacterium glaciei]
MLKLGFLSSRNGSSFRAILEAIDAGVLEAEARLLVSNNRKSGALEFAQARGVPHLCIPTERDPAAADLALRDALAGAGAELVVLSGYLRKLGPATLARYHNRIINIHPGLLPEFGGEGMYGRRVHEAVIAAGAPLSGATIHLVDEEYDRGPVLERRELALEPGETVDSLEARITTLEPLFFVETLTAIAAGDLVLP